LFFIPCNQYPKAQQNECLDNQYGFTDEYVWAKGGAYLSILSVYEAFFSPKPPIGIVQNRRQACAWIIVRGENSADRHQLALDTFGQVCADVSNNEFKAITERADVLLYELRTNPTTHSPSTVTDMITAVPDTD
jgi:hypothetical protein